VSSEIAPRVPRCRQHVGCLAQMRACFTSSVCRLPPTFINYDPKVSPSINVHTDKCYHFHRHRVSRAALGLDSSSSFAPTPPHSGRSSPYPGHYNASSDTAAFAGSRFADDLEGQNDEAIEGLSAKVKMLKEVRANSLFHSSLTPHNVGLWCVCALLSVAFASRA